MHNENDRENKVGLGVGYVSAMLIFAVLALTIFAALSFKAAASTDSFNERSGSFLKQYYAADSKAKEILAELHGYAADAAQSGFFDEEFEEAASGVEGVSVSRTPTGFRVGYTVDINDRQLLAVTLSFDKNGDYKTEQWQCCGSDTETSGEHLGVWDASQFD